jgi:ubiquinone/menaquinone biosynthesis C-methylase UbiE
VTEGPVAAERERTRRFFNLVAPAFCIIDRHLLPRYRLVLRRLRLPAGWSVLDIGTGTGTLATALVERGHPTTGIDTADRLLARARQAAPRADLRTMDLVDLPSMEHDSFDVVALAYVLHGLPTALCDLALAEARRLARQRVLVLDYDGRGPWYVRLVERVEGPHYRLFVERPMEDRLAEVGLEVERKIPMSHQSAAWLART